MWLKKPIELVVIHNVLQPSQDLQVLNGNNLMTLLKKAFQTANLPKSVQLFHGELLPDCEVTPRCHQDVDRLLKLSGKFYAVVRPQGLDPVSWLIIGASVLVSVAVALLLPKPTIPQIGSINQPPSPNNALANRSNRQRLGGRIVDGFGEFISVPDLIAPPYSVYLNHDEVEFSLMCIGRGQYEIVKAWDDTTPIEQIRGATVRVFGNGQSVYDPPQKQFGQDLTMDERSFSHWFVKKYTSVNGQGLSPPDNFVSVNITAENGGFLLSDEVDFRQFQVGEFITLSNAGEWLSANGVLDGQGHVVKYGLNGSFEVLLSEQHRLQLKVDGHQGWQSLADHQDLTVKKQVDLSVNSQTLWQGWFYTDDGDFDGIMLNLFAPKGLYNQSGDRWSPIDVEFVAQVQVLNADDTVASEFLQTLMISSRKRDKYLHYDHFVFSSDDEVRRSAGKTFFLPTIPKRSDQRVRFRIRRKTKLIKFDGQTVVQDVQLKDFFSVRALLESDVPDDVTFLCSKQLATEGALSLKERKLRILVRRYVKNWQDNDRLFLSKQADDIIYHIATDPKIGNLSREQVDMVQIHAEMNALRAYFGGDECGEFCYGFDDNNLSSEETLQTVANAVFSQLYRMDNQLRLHFERPQPVGVAIFNSHNMLPDSYQRSESFGVGKDFDGVTVKYVDPADDAVVSLFYPSDKSAVNADEKTMVGVRNQRQARVHLMRIWHKHLYSYQSIEFVGADESHIVMRGQRIDVADQLRVNVLQGVVVGLLVDGFGAVLTLSNPVGHPIGLDGLPIFIQLTNGQVDRMRVVVVDGFRVRLPRLPLYTISCDDRHVVQCVYQLVRHDDVGRCGFLVTQKNPDSGFSHQIHAINYDERYYAGDLG